LSVLEKNHWRLLIIVVVWRDVSSQGAEIDLVGMDEVQLKWVVRLMAQRGRRDYIRVGYTEN
jgi:hypothetical protein